MKLKLKLIIQEPELMQGSTITYQTKLTHPQLEGELIFWHGKDNREELLKSLNNSLMEDVEEIVKMTKNIIAK
jgi:hypothetical protein